MLSSRSRRSQGRRWEGEMGRQTSLLRYQHNNMSYYANNDIESPLLASVPSPSSSSKHLLKGVTILSFTLGAIALFMTLSIQTRVVEATVTSGPQSHIAVLNQDPSELLSLATTTTVAPQPWLVEGDTNQTSLIADRRTDAHLRGSIMKTTPIPLQHDATVSFSVIIRVSEFHVFISLHL